jgi:serine/threonine-protein kinase
VAADDPLAETAIGDSGPAGDDAFAETAIGDSQATTHDPLAATVMDDSAPKASPSSTTGSRPPPHPTGGEDARAFLQARLVLLWKMIAIVAAVVGTTATVADAIRDSMGAQNVLALVLVVTAAALWAATKQGTRSQRFCRTSETFGLLAVALILAVISRYVAANVGWTIIKTIPGVAPRSPIIDQVLTLTILSGLIIFMAARAAIVPSRPRRTIVLTAMFGIPFIVVSAFVDPPFDGSLSVSFERADFHAFAPLAFIWVLAVLSCSAISKVIYGLRAEVREAQQLGQYILEGKLGEGGMGVVYRARHGMMKRPTAVKLLSPGRASEDDVLRFEHEVQHTARLTHPNTITIFDYGRTADGTFYYAMELLDGATLDAIVAADGAQDPARVLRVLSMACGALSEAHNLGLIHRDIKPANIMLCSQGDELDVVKVLDFGLVKQLDQSPDLRVSSDDSIAGTPLYMAPESVTHPDQVDARTDLYALGAVGYFLLTGTDVFTGTSFVDIADKHACSKPEPPSQRIDSPVPADLESVILDCLDKVPGRRPQSATELRQRLEACAVGTWGATQAGAWWAEHDKAIRARQAPPTSGRRMTMAVGPR